MFSQQKKTAEQAYLEVESKAKELFPVVNQLDAGVETDEKTVQNLHERLDKLTGLTLGLQDQYNEKGMKELAQKAGNLYDQTLSMKERVERVAEKKRIPLGDEE